MAENPAPRRAGLFDIRFIIGALIGLYGVIIAVAGLFTSDSQRAKADGLNINLWAGVGMIVVGALFVAWAQWRPIVVPPMTETESDGSDGTDRPAAN